MFRNSSTSSTRRIRAVHVVAAGAIVVAMGGSATAAAVITGKQIKDNTVTSKDIKNGSLQVKDFKASEATKLRGPAGPAGTNGTNGTNGAAGTNGTNGAAGAAGAAGASAFAPPPSGTVIKGGGILNVDVDAADVFMRSYSPLPFTTSTPLTGANVWFGTENSASLGAFDTSAVKCPGTATAPDPTAGTMCVYVKQVTNIKAGSGELFPGASDFADAAESTGFYVLAESGANGPMVMRYVWAYKAP